MRRIAAILGQSTWRALVALIGPALAMMVWSAPARADAAPVPTVDPKLVVIAIAFGAVVVIAVIALLVIRRLRRQRTAQERPGSGPQNGGGGEER